MENKKLLIISKYATTINEGFETRTCELAYKFSTRNYDVTLLTSDSNHLATFPKYQKIFNKKVYLGVTFWWIRTLKYGNSSAFKRIISWLDFELKCFWLLIRGEKQDIVIVSSLSLLSILNGICMKVLWKSKLIFEVRDIWPLTLIHEGGYSQWNPAIIILNFIEKMGYRYADHIVGTMPNLKKHVEEQLGLSEVANVTCVPFGIHREITFDQKKESETNIFKKKDSLKVGYAGSLGISNGLENLIEAISISNQQKLNIEFLIIGDGALRKKFEEETSACENVTFTGKVKRGDVNQLLKYCDVLFFAALPSKIWEYGWSPNKLIDYMMAEKPIIAAYDGFRSMINEAGCGYFIKAGCTNSILKELLRLKEEDKNHLKIIGERGKTWLLKNRTWDNLSEDYISIFNNITSLR